MDFKWGRGLVERRFSEELSVKWDAVGIQLTCRAALAKAAVIRLGFN